jgi:single-strand DNA-binding protein
MHDINRVVLVGRLTQDPELRSIPSGTAVCNLRLANNSRQKEPDGEWGERPNFFDVAVFGPHAENVAAYMRRGRRVCVDGRLSWREWETSEEQKRQSVSIVADSVQFMDPPGDRAEDQDALVGAAAGDGAGEPF